ncbi:sensor histidine kinase [Nocardiopsis alkaliphila]|uniref:sensor histidine kinase n=1 Tax=Nocardiopsis alkaliphila TaxID=225762 RepID=UPI0003491D77|nr:histidine kinase [Nocardiopsis alkaliphila]
MRIRTGLAARWRRLDSTRLRELRLVTADWLWAVLPLPLSLQFQIVSLDGWGLWGGPMGALIEQESARYGSLLPGLLYIGLPVLFASAVTLLRREYPLWLMGVAFVLLLGFANPLPMLVAVYSHAAHSRSPVYSAVWGAVYVVTVVVVYREEGGVTISMVVSTTLALLVLGLFVSTRRRLLESLRERAERLERERYLLAEQAIAAERTRIAREMHDVVAHRVSLIVLHAGGLEVATAESSTATTAELIRRTGRQALGELRDILGVLREDSVIAAPKHPRSELEDIRELIAQWREAGMRVEFHPNASSIEDLAPNVRRMAFHVVKEALTNAAKHATGAQVCVRLDRLPRALRVEVVNGAAPETAPLGPRSGFGLIGLRERVAAMGATMDVGPDAEGGWRLTVELPQERNRALEPFERGDRAPSHGLGPR